MHSPVLIPLLIAAAMIMVCLLAGGNTPLEFFQEWQPATVYNAIQLFSCSLIAAAIIRTHSENKEHPASVKLFWYIVSGASLYFGMDELFQFHENSGPLAQLLRELFGQPGTRPFVAGFDLPSYSALVVDCYAIFVAAIGFLFRREILAQSSTALMFALAALLLGGYQLINLALLQEHGSLFGVYVAQSEPIFTVVAQSFKIAGCATVLGALMQTLLDKRQRVSIEKMLDQLDQSRSCVNGLNKDQRNLVDV